ncbi:MAG TPA: putative metal-dependent hydrolase [Thermoanaerobaculia bacterium]|nr:putative metal-dependent hydrolase [Thermoanaerobaculia bacterium]
MTDLRYPVGKARMEPQLTDEERREMIDQIEQAPARLRAAVEGLTAEQLDTPYRPEGWTVRQVAHHVPDSHLNAYIRFKLALTEEEPPVKTYEEALWAKLPDTASVPVEVSLVLLESLHRRWVAVLRSMSAGDFERTLRHPDFGVINLNQLLGMYSWHGRHHVAHVTGLRERMGW